MQALAEKESDGMAKMIYRKDSGEILGVHIFGLHAADLIHEASNAMATRQRVQVHLQLQYPYKSVSLECPCSADDTYLITATLTFLLGLQDIKFNVHSHPTLSEVLDELFKQAHLEKPDRPDAKPAAAQKMPQEARV